MVRSHGGLKVPCVVGLIPFWRSSHTSTKMLFVGVAPLLLFFLIWMHYDVIKLFIFDIVNNNVTELLLLSHCPILCIYMGFRRFWEFLSLLILSPPI